MYCTYYTVHVLALYNTVYELAIRMSLEHFYSDLVRKTIHNIHMMKIHAYK